LHLWRRRGDRHGLATHALATGRPRWGCAGADRVAVVVTALRKLGWLHCRWLSSCWVGSALLACSGGPARPELEVDCSVEDDYEFDILQPMEGTTASWYSYGDVTPGAIRSVGLQPIPGGRCESTTALVITSQGHHDWGSGFGEYQTAMAPVDA